MTDRRLPGESHPPGDAGIVDVQNPSGSAGVDGPLDDVAPYPARVLVSS